MVVVIVFVITARLYITAPLVPKLPPPPDKMERPSSDIELPVRPPTDVVATGDCDELHDSDDDFI